METWAWLETPEAQGHPEKPVSLAYPDVQVQKGALVQWGDWADLAPLVRLVLLVMLDLLDSLDPLESKVSLVQQAAPDHPAPWAVVTVSGTRW